MTWLILSLVVLAFQVVFQMTTLLHALDWKVTCTMRQHEAGVRCMLEDGADIKQLVLLIMKTSEKDSFVYERG